MGTLNYNSTKIHKQISLAPQPHEKYHTFISDALSHYQTLSTPWVKKNQDTLLMMITSQNINQFSKFFHC